LELLNKIAQNFLVPALSNSQKSAVLFYCQVLIPNLLLEKGAKYL